MKVKLLSHVWLFATPWTVAYQAPPSMGFSRQECWSGLPFPSPGDLPDPGIKPRCPALQAGKPIYVYSHLNMILTSPPRESSIFLHFTEEDSAAQRVLLTCTRSAAPRWQNFMQSHIWGWSLRSLHLSLDLDQIRVGGVSHLKILNLSIMLLRFTGCLVSEHSLWSFAKIWDWW